MPPVHEDSNVSKTSYEDAPKTVLPQQPASVMPTPVVRVLSPYGVEYVFLTIALFVAALSLVGILLSLVNGRADFAALSAPTAALLVAVPVFIGFSLRLKKLEVQDPKLRLDASKRRSTQFTQIVSFLACFLTLIGLVAVVFAHIGGQTAISLGKAFLNALCILAVAGGILGFYWNEEHRARR